MVVCFSLLVALTLPARADYNIKRITDNYQTNSPKVNNRGMVVWSQMDPDPVYYVLPQIYLYNNGSISKISTTSRDGFLPGLNDKGQITYWGLDEASLTYQVYLYDNGTRTMISSTNFGNRIEAPSAESQYPHINNNGQIVWTGSDGFATQVFLRSPEGTVYKISHNDEDGQPRGNAGVDINDAGQVVWVGFTSMLGNREIYLYQNGGAYQITYPGSYEADQPRLNSSGQIVWRARTAANDYYLYYYTGTVAPVVQVDSYTTSYALTDGGDILFAGVDGLGYRYSQGAVSRISTAIHSVGYIIAKGYQSVFTADDNAHHMNLYVYGNGVLKKVTSIYAQYYDIATSGQVAWNGGTGVYLATPRNSVPAIIPLLLN
jgi:hypothetical protein